MSMNRFSLSVSLHDGLRPGLELRITFKLLILLQIVGGGTPSLPQGDDCSDMNLLLQTFLLFPNGLNLRVL